MKTIEASFLRTKTIKLLYEYINLLNISDQKKRNIWKTGYESQERISMSHQIRRIKDVENAVKQQLLQIDNDYTHIIVHKIINLIDNRDWLGDARVLDKIFFLTRDLQKLKARAS